MNFINLVDKTQFQSAETHENLNESICIAMTMSSNLHIIENTTSKITYDTL